MKPRQQTKRYHYTRDRDGWDDVFDVWDALAKRCVCSVPFWDSVPGEEEEAEEEARRIVRTLNLNAPRHVRSFDDVA